MKEQQIFDTVALHLMTQMEKATYLRDDTMRCAYRAGDKSCAIGCMIPDEMYFPEMEGMRVDALLKKFTKVFDHIIGNDPTSYYFLSKLQGIHDCYKPFKWLIRLRAFAVQNNLKQPDCIKNKE